MLCTLHGPQAMEQNKHSIGKVFQTSLVIRLNLTAGTRIKLEPERCCRNFEVRRQGLQLQILNRLAYRLHGLDKQEQSF